MRALSSLTPVFRALPVATMEPRHKNYCFVDDAVARHCEGPQELQREKI